MDGRASYHATPPQVGSPRVLRPGVACVLSPGAPSQPQQPKRPTQSPSTAQKGPLPARTTSRPGPTRTPPTGQPPPRRRPGPVEGASNGTGRAGAHDGRRPAPL